MGRLLEAARTNVKVALRDGGKTLPAGEAVRVGGAPTELPLTKPPPPSRRGRIKFTIFCISTLLNRVFESRESTVPFLAPKVFTGGISHSQLFCFFIVTE